MSGSKKRSSGDKQSFRRVQHNVGSEYVCECMSWKSVGNSTDRSLLQKIAQNWVTNCYEH